jgi:hypothetical protein
LKNFQAEAGLIVSLLVETLRTFKEMSSQNNKNNIAPRNFIYPKNILNLLATIDTSANEGHRHEAIETLAKIKNQDAYRALMEVYRVYAWRDTKKAIIQALGHSTSQRVVEFLIRIANSTSDLYLAREAIYALTNSSTFDATMYITSILDSTDHPLLADVLSSIDHMRCLPNIETFRQLLTNFAKLSPQTQQNLIQVIQNNRLDQLWVSLTEAITKTPDLADNILECYQQISRLFTKKVPIELQKQISSRLTPLMTYDAEKHQALNNLLQPTNFLDAINQADTIKSCEHFYKELLKTKLQKDDLQFIANNLKDPIKKLYFHVYFPKTLTQKELNESVKAYSECELEGLKHLVRNWILSDNKNTPIFHNLFENLKIDTQCKIAQALDPKYAIPMLSDIITQNNQPNSTVIEAINSLVSFEINDLSQKHRKQILGTLKNCLNNKKNSVNICGRLLRALGQIYCDNFDFMYKLLDPTRKPHLTPSFYYALGLVNSKQSLQWLTDKLIAKKQQPYDDGAELEIQLILTAISEHTVLLYAEQKLALTQDLIKTNQNSLLMIMSRQSVANMAPLVSSSLATKSHQKLLLTLSAVAQTDDLQLKLQTFQLVKHSNQEISQRALYAIAHKGSPFLHLKILEEIRDNQNWSTDFIIKILKWVEPTADPKYTDFIVELEHLRLKDKRFLHQELDNTTLYLIDSLRIILNSIHPESPEQNTATPPEPPSNDQTVLYQNIYNWSEVSENIRTVLRNAELTFHHKNLFDEHVDKSTVIVEYVKSIDLLLQEKIVPIIFKDGGEDLLSKLQSRVLLLKIDDDHVSTSKRIRDLSCQNHFDQKNFPAYKLSNLSRSILSGKILTNRNRAIDGLRAWAIILLIFARQFRFNGLRIEPILKIAKPDQQTITALAATLNSLQEQRNHAAHRATILSAEEVSDFRNMSIKTFNMIIEAV